MKKYSVLPVFAACGRFLKKFALVFSLFLLVDEISFGQNVGIDVDPPLSKLHVNGGILATGSDGNTPVSGNGTRLMWIPAKAAFRLGTVTTNYWDDANIGTYSFASGSNTRALGSNSVAMGSNVRADGFCNICLGSNNITSGSYTFSIGKDNTGSGQSLTFGTNNQASALNAVAIGGGNIASNSYAIAMGGGSLASGYSSLAIGDHATASGSYSNAVGLQTTSQSYCSFVTGRYNLISGTSGSWINSEPLFIIGNGLDGANRNNALTVYKNGNAELDGSLDIKGILTQNSDSLLWTSAAGTSTHLGLEAGKLNTGNYNTIVGYQASKDLTSGQENTTMGYASGYSLNEGNDNTFLGYYSGLYNSDGEANTFIGALAGMMTSSGIYNTYVGVESGANATGGGNVLLGHRAGYNESGSNKLYIANTDAGSPLIYGDFSSHRVGINTKIPAEALQVIGNVMATGFIGDGSGLSNLNSDDDWEVSGNYVFNPTDSVGIGTSTPSQQFEVTGSINIPNTSGSGSGIIFKDDVRFIHNFKSGGANGNNVFVGNSSGNFTMSGSSYQGSANVGLGSFTLTNLNFGYENIAIGAYAMSTNINGHENVGIGNWALKDNSSGNSNTTIGALSLQVCQGDNNTALGFKAGYNITDGSGNIIIGANINAPSATASNQLNIGNTIYGDLSTHNVGMGTTSPNSSAILDLSSTSKGFLPPRMTRAERDLMNNPPEGLVIYDKTTKALEVCDGSLWGAVTGEFICGINQVEDTDGNPYNTVEIGTQCWMLENLNIVVGNSWCYYDNPSNCDTYGRLYDWTTIMNGSGSSNSVPSGVQGICPNGWHLPSDAEWDILVNYLGGSSVAGGKIKESGTTHWQVPNIDATNESGFTALPGGKRTPAGTFISKSQAAYFWTSYEYNSADAYVRSVQYNVNSVLQWTHDKNYGYSVRCLKD